MQFIPKKWYVIYNWTLVGVCLIFIVLYLVTKFIPGLNNIGNNLHLTLNGTFFAVLTVIGGSIGFTYLSKNISSWMGAIVSAMLFDLFLIAQLSTTHNPYSYVYVILWFAVIIYSGAFGLIVVLTNIFLAFLIGILKSNSSLISSSNEFKILIMGTIILGIVPYVLFWRIKIRNTSALTKVSAIEGMPDDTQKQNETLIESIADGIIVVDIIGKISLINPAASNMCEWDTIDALGIDINLVLSITKENGEEFTPESNPINQVISSKQKTELNVNLTGHKGKKIIASMVVSPVLVNGNTVAVVGVLRDITAQKAAEKQRADFISTASHEMRTPVAAIEGYLSLAMNDKVSSIDTRARDFLEKAHQSTRQLGKLFQDLLTSSRAEDGRLVNHPQVVEMGQFIQHLSESFSLVAESKHLIVDYVLIGEDGLPQIPDGKMVSPLYYIHVDPDRMSEVVTNIYDNAVKYTQTGKITVGLGGDSRNIQLFIKDTGSGIPPEDVPHLFQKFYRVDNSAVRTIGGTGLGLFICKKIIELYGGQIWVESDLGRGSTFRINIPRLTTQQAEVFNRTETMENQIAMPQSNVTL